MDARGRLSRRRAIKATAATMAVGALTTVDIGGSPAGQALLHLAKAAAPAAAPDLSRDRVVATLPAGKGNGQVGISPFTGGPQALTIAPDGRILVLDAMNRRLMTLSPTGTIQGAVPVGSDYPRDVLVTADDRQLVLNTDEVIELAPGGALLRRLPITKSIAGGVTGLVRGTAAEIVVEVEGANRVYLTEGGRPVAPSSQGAARYRRIGLTTPGRPEAFNAQYDGTDVPRRTAVMEVVGINGVIRRLPIPVTGGVGSAEILGVDAKGDHYLLITDVLPDQGEVRVDRTVRRYSADGMPGAVARVPVVGRHMAPQRDVALGPDGQVYTLLVLSDRALVVRLGFVDRLPALPAPSSGLAEAVGHLTIPSAAAVPLLPEPHEPRVYTIVREDARNMAEQYYNKTWHCDQSNWTERYGTWRPIYINSGGYNRNYYEVPYCWGGWQSLGQFNTSDWNGATCGDINDTTCCYNSQANAGGVDCSGFIQNCWYQTATKYNDTGLTQFCVDRPSSTNMLLADMYRRPNRHVRLFNYYNGSYTGAYVYESATPDNSSRVWMRYYSLGDLSGYERWRWRGY